MRKGIELLDILAESEEEVKHEKVAPVKDTFDDLRTLLKKRQDYLSIIRGL